MDLDAFEAELDVRLDDADNFAFTAAEKTSLVSQAIKDAHVVKSVWDDSLAYAKGTWQYAVPSGVTTIKDIYIKVGTNEDPETVSVPFEVVEDNIHFKKGSRVIPDGYTLYIRGNYKYTTADTITDTRIQEYILNLAQLNALRSLGIKKTMKFLKNDASVAEIIAMKRELEREVSQHRGTVQREFQAA